MVYPSEQYCEGSFFNKMKLSKMQMQVNNKLFSSFQPNKYFPFNI